MMQESHDALTSTGMRSSPVRNMPIMDQLEVQNTLHESRERRMLKIRPWLQGAGLAMLYLLPLFAIFLAPAQGGFYHQVMPITSLTRGALLDLLLMGLLLGAGLAWLNTLQSSLTRRLLWIPVLFVTSWIAERSVAEFISNISVGTQFLSWAPLVPRIVLASTIPLFLFARRYYDMVVQAAELFLMSAGIAAIFVVLPQVVFACFNHAPPEQAFFAHPVGQPWRPGEPRVVWILFDELSYDQVFDHPYPGIHLPAFTRLQQESVSFSQLAPVGNLTELVIPSLFSGQVVTRMKSNRQGELFWRSSPEMSWQSFQPDTTVFAAARRQGWGTGVAGWYNPYCRLLATTLDRCYWTYQEFATGARFSRLSSQRSTWENARDGFPLVAQMENAWQHSSSSRSHKDDYRRVMREAKSLIEDKNIRFAFIHLPIPHPPGIFEDPAGSSEESYLGNLILADRALAELRAAIATTPAAADTILIASSDHSWRVPMWRGFPGWTGTEERITRNGYFDQRPVLMVHFPGEFAGEPASVDRPRSAMIVHSLLLDLFAGKIGNLQQLRDAIDAAPSVAAP